MQEDKKTLIKLVNKISLVIMVPTLGLFLMMILANIEYLSEFSFETTSPFWKMDLFLAITSTLSFIITSIILKKLSK